METVFIKGTTIPVEKIERIVLIKGTTIPVENIGMMRLDERFCEPFDLPVINIRTYDIYVKSDGSWYWA